MSIPYIPPGFDVSAFNCPLCQAYASQKWMHIHGNPPGMAFKHATTGVFVAVCTYCDKYSIWFRERMLYPAEGPAPPANGDLPDEIKSDYEEARRILASSPRAAAALLRLVIQKLCRHLGEKGENINTDIGNLVKKGLPAQVQQALDIVRVVGNNAVHPGTIDLKDDIATATGMFGLVNFIADAMISQPNRIQDLYGKLPQPQLDQINKRDQSP